MKNKISEVLKASILNANEDFYSYKSVKQMPSEWIEKNIFLPDGVTRYPGLMSYEWSPYTVEIVDSLHPSDSVRMCAVMKGAQIGLTAGLIVPGMAWIIAEHPDHFCFAAGDKETAKKTIRERFDPIMQESKLDHLIRPNSVRDKNQRTGNTDFSKEFAGGVATITGCNKAGNFRFWSAKIAFIDDFDKAPKNDTKEGNISKLIDGRQTSYGNIAKTYYVSTPTTTVESNVYEKYLLGDQRKWNWPCSGCGEFIPVEWQIKKEDGSFAGLVWKMDENKELIENSIRYKCPKCDHEMHPGEKHELNQKGKWIPTAVPKNRFYRSYQMNSLISPPGFVSWLKLVEDWLEACPPGKSVSTNKLKTFFNIHLGLPYEERGEAPKIMKLMENIGEYKPGVVPDQTCEEEGNGQIMLLTLAADLGGRMKADEEDVRIDWEVIAHTSTGATYSIDQGQCGTFKRGRTKSKAEKENDHKRKRYTYRHGASNSAWPLLDEVIKKEYVSESGDAYGIKLSIIDTGHFTKQAYEFVKLYHTSENWIFGIKGIAEEKYRKTSKILAKVVKSPNIPSLYLLDVEQLKDDLAANMKLQLTDTGYQESGFMNFPRQEGGKYSLKRYFKHFESEARKEVMDGGEVIGFKWDKKSTNSENHFWDVAVYNLAARLIFLDLLKRSDRNLKDINWANYVELYQ